jgi:putative nucleotidyltransferase with HDIG domain
MNLKEGFEFIDKIEELSAMPAIALDIMGMLNDPSSAVKDIVAKVRLDQAMVSYILKHCNSPFYGIRQEVNSIARAISLLGFTNLKSILMSYFMRNLYHLSGKNEIKEYLWKHSVAVAIFSKNLSHIFKMDADEGYVAGLLHDIGKIVLYLDDSNTYQNIVKMVEEGKGDFLSSEKQMLQFTHVDIGYILLEKWKFSQILKDVILYHHDLQLFVGTDKIIGVVCFADHLAHVFMERRYENLDGFMEQFNIKESTLDQLVEKSTVEIEQFYSLL